MFNPKYLADILTRSTHSGFKTMVLSNRMLLQCYTVDIDCDQGFHYALHIPDNEHYDDPFYDETLIISPSAILKCYKDGHKEADDVRKERKLKPKDLVEEGYYVQEKDSRRLKFVYSIGEELICTRTVDLRWPFDETDMSVSAIVDAYDGCIDRIKPGGVCLVYDLIRMDLIDKTLSCPGVYRFIVRVNGKKVVVPLTRTLFLGAKKFDAAYLAIQETSLNNIYLYTLSLRTKDIGETIWGYLIRY